MSVADDRIDIDINADDNASGALRTVIKTIDDLGDIALKQAGKVRALERSVAELKDEALDMAARMKAAEASIKKMGNEAVKSAAKIQALELAMKNLGGAGSGLGGGRGGRVPGGFFGGIMNGGRKLRGFLMFMLIPVIGDAVGALATLGGAAVAAGAAAVGALAPLLGLVAALPGALAAVGSGAAATMVGLKGMGEAIQTLWDPDATTEELDAAMKGLTRNGRELAFTIAEMRQPARKLQREVQMALTPGLNNLAKTVKDAIPWFQELFGRSGYRVGMVAKDLSSLLQQTRVQEQVARIMLNSKELITSFGAAALSAFRALLNIMVAAGPMIQRLADDLAAWAENLADVTDRNGPAMVEFFEKTYNVTKDLIKFIADLSMGLYNVFKIGADLGGEMGDSFLDMGEKFRNFTESITGQESIQNWFNEMRPVIYEVGYLIRDMGKGLGELSMDGTLVGTLKSIRTDLLPALLDFLKAVSGKFLPLIADILTSIARVLTEIEFFPVILDVIATAFGGVAAAVSRLPDILKKVLGYVIAIAAVLKFATFIGIFRGMGVAAGTATKKVGFLSRATGALGRAAAMGPQIAVAAFAAMGLAALNSAQDIDNTFESIEELKDSLAEGFSTEGFKELGTMIDDVLVKLNSSKWENTGLEAYLNSDAWGDTFRRVGHFFKTAGGWLSGEDWDWGAGPELAQDRYQQAVDELLKMESDILRGFNTAVGSVYSGSLDSDEAENIRAEMEDIAAMLNIDWSKGIDVGALAVANYYRAVNMATPASGEFYKSLLVLQDGAVAASAKVDAFASAINSLRSAMTGGDIRDAGVEAAKGFSTFADSFEGAVVKIKKGGEVVFKETAKNNWNLYGALTSQVGAIENVAVATMQSTGDIGQAVDAYSTQYYKLLRQTQKGLEATGMESAEASYAATKLIEQYALTPEQMTTIFKVNPQGILELQEAGIEISEILKFIENPLDPTIDPAALTLMQQTIGAALGQPVTVPVQAEITVPKMDIPQSVLQGMPDISTSQGTAATPEVSTTGLTPAVQVINDINTGLTTVGATSVTPLVPTSGMSAAASMVSNLKNDLYALDRVGTITITYIPGRAIGGPVESGMTYMVGEVGPEMFVSRTGQTSMIGVHGPEIKRFASDGYVIPNHALPSEDMSSDQMRAVSSLIARKTAMSPSREYAEVSSQQAIVNIGTVNAKSDIDIVKAVKKGIVEAERNRRERS